MPFGAALMRLSKRLSRRNLYPFLDDSLTSMPQGSAVLNVGAGGEVAATVMAACAKRKATVVSLDISPAREPDVVGDICESSFEAEFDAVVMADVLEHIPRPHVALERVLAALRPGGRLIMSAPFIFPLHDRPHDYFRFTKYGLAHLLRDYADVEIRQRDEWAASIAVLFARFITERHGRPYFTAMLVMGAAVLYPLAVAISRIYKTDFLTSGYLVTAYRRRESGGVELHSGHGRGQAPST